MEQHKIRLCNNKLDFSESRTSLDSSLANLFYGQQNDIFASNVNNKMISSIWVNFSDNYTVNENLAEINQFGNKNKTLNALSDLTLNEADSRVFNANNNWSKFSSNSNDKLAGLSNFLYRRTENERTELYTTEFVNSIKEAFSQIPKPVRPSPLKNCDCAEIKQDALVKIRDIDFNQQSSSYGRLMQSQFNKNVLSVLSYAEYHRAKANKQTKLFDFYNFILGMAYYWENNAAIMSSKNNYIPKKKQPNPLLRAACLPHVKVVQDWREGNPSESRLPLRNIPTFSAATSAVGDLGLGIISKLLGYIDVGMSYKWGQFQEAAVEYEVCNNCSGIYLDSSINPSNLFTLNKPFLKELDAPFRPHLIPQFVWIDFTLDILNFDSNNPQDYEKKAIKQGIKLMDKYRRQGINERSFYLASLAFARMPKSMQKENSNIWNLVNQHDISENDYLEHVLENDTGVNLGELGISNQRFFRLKSQKKQLKSVQNKVNNLALKAHRNVVDDINELRSITSGTNQTICDLYDKVRIGSVGHLVCEVPAD